MNEKLYDIALDVLNNPVLESWTFTDSELKQYVRLIVLECATIAETAEPYQSHDLIKKHFGVE